MKLLTLAALVWLTGCQALQPLEEHARERRQHELELLQEAIRAQPIYITILATPLECDCCNEKGPPHG